MLFQTPTKIVKISWRRGGTGQQVTRVTIFGPTSQWTPSASAHWHCSASSDPSSSSSRGSRSPALSFGSRRSAPREVVRGGCWAGSRRRIWAKGTGVFLAFFLSLGTFYDLHFFFFSLFPHFSFLTPLRLGLCLRGSPSSVRLGFLSKYIPLYTPFCLSSSPPPPLPLFFVPSSIFAALPPSRGVAAAAASTCPPSPLSSKLKKKRK